MLEIVYRPRALQQIDEIADRTIANWGNEQARAYLSDIRRQIEFAAEFPGIGSAVYGLPSNYRKVHAGSHRVVYRVDGPRLVVVRIIHEREDIPDERDY